MRQFCKVECSNGVILHVNKFHFNTPLGAIKCNRNNKKNITYWQFMFLQKMINKESSSLWNF